MSLFKRLPFGTTKSWPTFPKNAQSEFPRLSERFSDLSTHLDGAFAAHDAAALQQQQRHRALRLALIVGAMFTTVFGALQAALGSVRWPGIALAIIAAATAAIVNYERQANPLRKYLHDRAKAEALRSLYFNYLGSLDVIDQQALAKAVAEIQFGKKPGNE